MNKNRTIQILAFASLFVTVLTAPAFAADGQLPSTVPSQETMPPPPQAAPVIVPTPGPAPQTAMPPIMAPPSSKIYVPPSKLPPGGKTAPQSMLSLHPNAPLQAKQVGDITYLTGGVGDKEMEQLKAEANNYNLQIMNSDGSGHFVSSNDVVISSRDGRQMISVENTGPLFYAQLPPGDYKVEITHGDRHETKNVKITAKGKPANVYLFWK